MEVLDPVCGMRFDSDEAVASVEHEGTTYYFCGEGCKEAFEEDPQRFVGGESKGEAELE